MYYNPTSTSNLIEIRLVKAILNKATQDLATSYRGHLRLTLSFANEITAVKILTGSSDMSFFSPKKPVCPKCSKQSLGNCMCPHNDFEFVVCLSHKKIADRTDFKHNFGMESLALSL